MLYNGDNGSGLYPNVPVCFMRVVHIPFGVILFCCGGLFATLMMLLKRLLITIVISVCGKSFMACVCMYF